MSEYRFPKPFVYENNPSYAPKLDEPVAEEEEEKM
jgi:hypothetical protein